MNYSFIRKHVTRPSFALVFVVIVLVAGVIYSNIYDCPFVFDDERQIVEKVIIRDLTNYLSLEAFLKPRPIVDLTFALNYRFGQLTVFGYHLLNVLIHITNGFLVYFLALTIFKQLLSGSAQRFDKSSKVKGERGKVKAESLKLKGERSKLKARRSKLKARRSKLKARRSKLKARSSKLKGQSSKDNTKHKTSNILLSDGSAAYTGFQSSIINHQSSINLMSLFAALIFVAHPIQTQAVTYTIQRYASLAAMFYMGSVLFYLKARVFQQRAKSEERRAESKERRAKGEAESSKVKAERSELARRQAGGVGGAISYQLSTISFFALSILCGMLAFLSKQNTASLPAAIILVEYLFIDRTWRGWKKKILWFIPAFMVFAIFVLYVCGFFSGGYEGRGLLEDVSDLMREPDTVGRWSYLCTQFNVLVIYIRLLFLPMGQNLDYLYPFKSGFFDAYTPLAFMFLAGLVALGIWNRKKQPIVTFGIFWFFIALSVESGIIPISDALFEHRLYLPMFGFAIVVSYLLFSFFSKKRLWAIIICLSIIISFGTATYLRNRIWQDGLTLWSDVLAKNPENLRGHNNVGVALMDKGHFREAFGYFSGVLRAEPENANAHYNSGVALEKQGRLDEAIQHYSEVLRIRPGHAKAHYNLGVALARRGDLDRAIRHYTKALRIRTDYVEARVNLGVVLAEKGELYQAISHLSKALQIEPENAKVHNNLGGALAVQGRLDEAIHHYTKALLILPGHAKAHYDLGNLLASQGDLDRAIHHLSEVVRLSPDDNIPACYNIACAYARQNKIEESIVWLKKAVDKGFKRWELLKTDKDMDNIRGSSYYKKIIEGLRD